MRPNEQRLPLRRDDPWAISPWSESGSHGPGTFFTSSPWQMMRRMHDDMDRLFGQFFGETPGFGNALATSGQWSPSMDVSESGKEWCIEADLPGVNREDIDVQVRDHHLILRAELRQPATEEQDDRRRFHRRERRYGYFERIMPLPVNVNEDAIACEFRDGVLSIRLPKTEGTAPGQRRIPVMDVAKIPSETAGGRNRSRAELSMTSGDNNGGNKANRVPIKGAKGGTVKAPGTGAPGQPAGRGKVK